MTLRHRILPAERRKQLKTSLVSGAKLRIIEAHNGLSALIGSTTEIDDQCGFDGLWISSLTDSAAKGHPDTEVIDSSSRLQTIQQLLQVTCKPVIVDGDTGGESSQFEYFCAKLESMGVSAVIIEDKQYPKRNSLEKDAIQLLEDPVNFAIKVNRAKAVCLSDDFMIFTRIESFIAGRGLDDALHRAHIYLNSSADGILIHSNASTPEQIYAFVAMYKKLCKRQGLYKPLVCVPTTYSQVTDIELFEKGFDIVIYANHQLRAAYQAMQTVCQSILSSRRSGDALKYMAPVSNIMDMVGFSDIKTKDVYYQKHPRPVIILGAGKASGFVGTQMESIPVSGIPIAGQTLLQRQYATLKALGLHDITLLSGYGQDQLPTLEIDEIYNENFVHTKVADSLMMACDKMSNGFIMLFGDLIFDKKLLQNYLLNVDSDILLLVDNSFNLTTRYTVKPTTDLVILNGNQEDRLRKPNILTELIVDIGHQIPVEKATHEFIGIAQFSKQGAQLLNGAYQQIKQLEANTPIDFNRLIQQLIKEGVAVEALEVHHGWSEVHTLSDIAAIEKEINRLDLNKRDIHVPSIIN